MLTGALEDGEGLLSSSPAASPLVRCKLSSVLFSSVTSMMRRASKERSGPCNKRAVKLRVKLDSASLKCLMVALAFWCPPRFFTIFWDLLLREYKSSQSVKYPKLPFRFLFLFY
mmetsp:Transcript_2003/g.5389  ORF Transcript_2003/g.5389 Transcript_2003/m.5389 type:complete len:114 (-) Transcript_2003:39-380(-)